MLRPVLAIAPAFSGHQIFEIEPRQSHGDGDPDNGSIPKQRVVAKGKAKVPYLLPGEEELAEVEPQEAAAETAATSSALAAGELEAVEASQAATASQATAASKAAAAEGAQLPDGQARGEGRGDREAAGGDSTSAIMPFTASVPPFEFGWYVVSQLGGEGTSQKRGPSTSMLDTEGGAWSRGALDSPIDPVPVFNPGGSGCSQSTRTYM